MRNSGLRSNSGIFQQMCSRREQQRTSHNSLEGFQRGEVHNSLSKGLYPFPVPGNNDKGISPSKNCNPPFGINKSVNPFNQQSSQQNNSYDQRNIYQNNMPQNNNLQDNRTNFLQRRENNSNNNRQHSNARPLNSNAYQYNKQNNDRQNNSNFNMNQNKNTSNFMNNGTNNFMQNGSLNKQNMFSNNQNRSFSNNNQNYQNNQNNPSQNKFGQNSINNSTNNLLQNGSLNGRNMFSNNQNRNFSNNNQNNFSLSQNKNNQSSNPINSNINNFPLNGSLNGRNMFSNNQNRNFSNNHQNNNNYNFSQNKNDQNSNPMNNISNTSQNGSFNRQNIFSNNQNRNFCNNSQNNFSLSQNKNDQSSNPISNNINNFSQNGSFNGQNMFSNQNRNFSNNSLGQNKNDQNSMNNNTNNFTQNGSSSGLNMFSNNQNINCNNQQNTTFNQQNQFANNESNFFPEGNQGNQNNLIQFPNQMQQPQSTNNQNNVYFPSQEVQTKFVSLVQNFNRIVYKDMWEHQQHQIEKQKVDYFQMLKSEDRCLSRIRRNRPIELDYETQRDNEKIQKILNSMGKGIPKKQPYQEHRGYREQRERREKREHREHRERICSFYTSRSSSKTSDRIQYLQKNPKITLTSSKSTSQIKTMSPASEYKQNPEESIKVSCFGEIRKLQYIIDLRWEEDNNFVRRSFPNSTIDVTDNPSKQELSEAIMLDLINNSGLKLRNNAIAEIKQRKFGPKKETPNFLMRLLGKKEIITKNFLLIGSIMERKINLPKEFTYSPNKFEGFLVSNLMIQNHFGRIQWFGQTYVQNVDFSTGIFINQAQAGCTIQSLMKQAIVQFNLWPSWIPLKYNSDQFEKAFKKRFPNQDQYPCFISCDDRKKSWKVKVHFGLEQYSKKMFKQQ